MDSTVGTIQAGDGTSLHLQTWAQADAAPRATLLLAHGIFEHIGRYEHVAGFFVERGYEVHGYDHRGHGRSGGARLDIDRFERYADDMERAVRTLHRSDRPFVIYAHSMGGLIATMYAASQRPQPDMYILSAPALDAVAPNWQRAAARMLGRAVGSLRLTASISGEDFSRDPAVGVAYFADPLIDVKPTLRWGGLFLKAIDASGEILDRIRVPVLVIHGTDDRIVPPAASAPLAAIPGVERKLFPGLRHEMHNEPEQYEVLGFVAAWLDDQLASSG